MCRGVAGEGHLHLTGANGLHFLIMVKHNTITGFTLIEILVVLMIIAILMTLAIPDQTPRQTKLQLEEVLKYSEELKPKIKDYYALHNSFPLTNGDAELAPPNKLINTLIKETAIEGGAIHFTLGNNANGVLQDQTLSLQPLTVIGNSTSPIDWTCGFSRVPNGMEAKGENKTTIKPQYLPFKCMSTEPKKP